MGRNSICRKLRELSSDIYRSPPSSIVITDTYRYPLRSFDIYRVPLSPSRLRISLDIRLDPLISIAFR
jgi:hypothetical protein